jgi:hypothetical protein
MPANFKLNPATAIQCFNLSVENSPHHLLKNALWHRVSKKMKHGVIKQLLRESAKSLSPWRE